MTRREIAMNNFLEGYNCAQAVLIAYCDELGLDKDTAAMLSCSFGGGMGRLREVCGAVSGMFLVAGIKKGYSDPKDKEAKVDSLERSEEAPRLLGSWGSQEEVEKVPRTPPYSPKIELVKAFSANELSHSVCDPSGLF